MSAERSTSVRLAAFQFDVRRGDVAANLEAVEAGLVRAADDGVDLVVLPEMWPTSFLVTPPDRAQLTESDAAVERVRELSGELGLIVCGSAYGATEADRPANRLTVFERGELRFAYDKVHLFSPTAETEGFSGGDGPPPTVDSRVGTLSGVVCYDVRFAPLLRTPFLDGAEILVVAAQWPAMRAPHWRALVLGRAAEMQAFVVAANRTGEEIVGRRKLVLDFPGNSLVAGPDGVARAEGQGPTGLVAADVDLEDVRRLRRRVPVRRDERRDCY